MPKVTVKPADETSLAPNQSPQEEVLLPFSVIIDGVDRTIFAKDQEDLQRRVAKRMGQA